MRYIPIYLLIGVIFAGWLAREWQSAGRSTISRSSRAHVAVEVVPEPLFPKRPWLLVFPAAAIALTVTIALTAERSQFRRDPMLGFAPGDATTAYIDHYSGARLFNTYDFGGYMLYRFADTDNKVFIDGREEMYGEDLVRDYFDVAVGRDNWTQHFEEWDIQAVLVRPWDGIANRLMDVPAWRHAYSNVLSYLFVRSDVVDAAPASE
jgi:hypothetical protein